MEQGRGLAPRSCIDASDLDLDLDIKTTYLHVHKQTRQGFLNQSTNNTDRHTRRQTDATDALPRRIRVW